MKIGFDGTIWQIISAIVGVITLSFMLLDRFVGEGWTSSIRQPLIYILISLSVFQGTACYTWVFWSFLANYLLTDSNYHNVVVLTALAVIGFVPANLIGKQLTKNEKKWVSIPIALSLGFFSALWL